MFLWLISSWSLLRSESRHFIFLFFFMTKMYIWKLWLSWWILHVTLKKKICISCWMKYHAEMPFISVDWWWYWVYVPYWFSTFWICPFLKQSSEIFSSNSRLISYPLHFYQCLLLVAWRSFNRHIHITNCYLLLENWPFLSLCNMLFLSFTFKSALS